MRRGQLPEYITKLGLSQKPFNYTWEVPTTHNHYWSIADADNQPLADQLMLIDRNGIFSLGIACCEWIVARMVARIPVDQALLILESLWADTKTLPPLPTNVTSRPAYPPYNAADPERFSRPIVTAMKLIALAFEDAKNGGQEGYVFSGTMALAMLADYVTEQNADFRSWLHSALKKLQERYPRVDGANPEFVILERAFFDTLPLS